MNTIPKLVIAGVSSNVGKTTVVTALTLLFKERGLKVRCFKCGPDYLDPTYHKRASGEESVTLDSWMMGTEGVKKTFAEASQGFDLCLIEGVMGLFDGTSADSEEGSTAQIAKILGAPVILVVDASGMARSFAALVKGFKSFDPDLNFAGVIGNRAGSSAHLDLLKKSLLNEIRFLGGILKGEVDKAFPSRHLGLMSARENLIDDQYFSYWKSHVEKTILLDEILALSKASGNEENKIEFPKTPSLKSVCRIAYALDDAFHFYYQENLLLLKEAGAELIPFSPLLDEKIPVDISALYFGGGYPEVYAKELSSNNSMISSIRNAASAGMPIYGECGGLIYMSEEIENTAGEKYPFLGLIKGAVKLHSKLQELGYVEVEFSEKTILGPRGLRFRGHQFRYSEILQASENQFHFLLRKRRSSNVESEGYGCKNILASYVHAHWASNPQIAVNLVNSAIEFKNEH